jgi:hypothetical protein
LLLLLVTSCNDFAFILKGFASIGEVQILDLQHEAPAYHYNYEYDIRNDNYNQQTIQSFSTRAEETMYTCDYCPYPDYAKFVEYYGEFDYADNLIQAALNGTETSFKRGNLDFTGVDSSSRAEAMKIASKYMSLWMYTIRMMELSLDQCVVECGKRCDDLPVHSWGAAAAYYIGSKEGQNGEGEGKLMYDLADQMCLKFKTCEEKRSSESGTSAVNIEILNEFKKGQASVLMRDCEATRRSKDRIATLMAVPLVQSTILMAFQRQNHTAHSDDIGSEEKVTGAVMAGSVLPLVHDCRPHDAATIYQNMQVTSDEDVNFIAVKHALERNYKCMGISCELVGGLWENGAYGINASPCAGIDDQKGASVAAITLSSVGATIAVVLCIFFVLRRHRRKNSKFGIDDITGRLPGLWMEVTDGIESDDGEVIPHEVLGRNSKNAFFWRDDVKEFD